MPEIDWHEGDRERLALYREEVRPQHVPWRIVIRPVSVTADDPRSRDYDITLEMRPGRYKGFDVYPDGHYPACAQCREPVPCRDEMTRKLTEAAEKDAARYDIPGLCPACSEPVTSRHKVMTFEENLRVPLGPPVTFHVGRRDARRLRGRL